MDTCHKNNRRVDEQECEGEDMNDGEREVQEFRRMQKALMLDSIAEIRGKMKRCEICNRFYDCTDPANSMRETRCIQCEKESEQNARGRNE